MKFRKRNDITVNRVRQGYDPRDAMLLRRETNTPKTQIFSAEELEGEPEDRDYFCAMCKGKLDYIKNLEMWTCTECSSYYDTKIQDVPVKNTSEFRVTPWFELQHYPTAGMDDPETPFVEGIDYNAMLEDLQTRVQEVRRVQHTLIYTMSHLQTLYLLEHFSSKKHLIGSRHSSKVVIIQY